MKTSDRYKKLILASLEIDHLKQRLSTENINYNENILVSEFKGDDYCFNNKSANLAINELCQEGHLKLTKADHVCSQAEYKGMRVHLHEDISSLGTKAMSNIVKG